MALIRGQEVMLMQHFDHLFTPIKVGSITLKNRIVAPPLERNYCNRDGSVSDRCLAHFEELAKGGAGLLVMEASFVTPAGRGSVNQMGIWNDELVPGLRQLAKVVHNQGAAIAIELYHAGRQTSFKITGFQPISASPVPCPATGNETPTEMTPADIRNVILEFAQAARRAKEAGFDAVEFHGAHGYLPLQFLSPWSNRRSDEYGGSLENRMRFSLEVISAIRETVGRDFTVGCRFCADEFVQGGLTLDESTVFAQRLEQAGIDYLSVSAGIYETSEMIASPMGVALGVLVPLASAIRASVKVPVVAVNRIKDPVQAENVLAEGHADLVALGRALLADPNLPAKAKDGRLDDIVSCLSCNQGCFARIAAHQDVTCVVNPAAGREREFAIKPAAEGRRIMVVGGGPAGMEAARVAAMRGHDVTLYEKGPELGGQVRLAAAPPTREELGDIIRNLAHQMEGAGVKVVLGVEVTPELVRKESPDAVVIATGALPRGLRVPGADRPFVLTAQDVLGRKVEAGQRVVVVGADRIGAETAEYLADKGKTVDLIEESGELAPDMEFTTRILFMRRLKSLGNIKVHRGRMVREIEADSVVIDRTGAIGPMDEKKLGPVDTVVVALGRRIDDYLLKSLRSYPGEVYDVGDCVEPRSALEAIYEGSLVGRKV
ncbi:MAG: FAD-dependent oxidoreductase [Dehalococcoidia bacterium]|nr:FAD-dependent oxidoreductase [Dehalococcoidia bacterium]